MLAFRATKNGVVDPFFRYPLACFPGICDVSFHIAEYTDRFWNIFPNFAVQTLNKYG